MKSALVATLTLAVATLLVSQSTPPERVGPLPDGGFLLNSGWALRPAGTQVKTDTFPISSVLSKDGKFLLVLNAGYNQPSVAVISVADRREVHRVNLEDAWLGLSFSERGDLLYVGGGAKAQVHEFAFDADTGDLKLTRELNCVPNLQQKGVSFIGDVKVSRDGRLLYAADVMSDTVALINLRSGTLIERWKVGRRPYRITLYPDNKTFFLTSWGDSAVFQYDANSGGQISMTRVGSHPTDLYFSNSPAPEEEGGQATFPARLFVTASNTNNVYVFGVTGDRQLRQIEAVNTGFTPLHAQGMTPSSLSPSLDGKRLYVACSDANLIAVVDISDSRSRVKGYVSAGWYPTAVTTLKDNGLAVLNGKGAGSQPNPKGANAARRAPALTSSSDIRLNRGNDVGSWQTGTVQFVDPFDEPGLDRLTEVALSNSPYVDDSLIENVRGANVDAFVNRPGHESPIKHVIYIIKENRTYDQIFGDLERGNGDKSLASFGEKITPNHHKLAREYVLYDNFYTNGDVSAEGHNWATAAIVPDYTMKLWPNSYGGRGKAYDYEGGEPANMPPTGYLWNNAMQAGISIRNYGEWIQNVPLAEVSNDVQVKAVYDASLRPVTDLNYRGFDLDYADVDRSKEFLREWQQYDQQGKAPQLLMVRLGNDHTSGTAAGKLTPAASIADNDLALGQLVDGVSHSKLWASTAIFVIEDDAQNGPDHVDSHRAPAFVISPYTRRGGIVDGAMYNQMSILRTIEGIVGLRPMTHFDAAARTMFGSFATNADLQPFTAAPASSSLTARNGSRAK